MRAVDTLEFHFMGTELVEEPEMAAFADEIVVHRPQHRPEGIGIEHVPFRSGILRPESDRLAPVDLHLAFEQATGVARIEVPKLLPVESKGRYRFRMRNEGTQHPLPVDFV